MNDMKSTFFTVISLSILAVLTSCGGGIVSSQGELVGIKRSVPRPDLPYGMVYIPSGTFIMGQTDQDISFAQVAQNKQVSISSFYMDETEVTNSEYRQFVNWVRDSIAVSSYLKDDKFFMKSKPGAQSANTQKIINWDMVGDGSKIWGGKRSPDMVKKLESMYYQADDKISGLNELDVRILKYEVKELVYRWAAEARHDKTKKRSDFIFRDTVSIYPDTLVWLSDFAYAQNEPMVQTYFSHPSYDNYPVVGVTWRQARAFTVWRTNLHDSYRRRRGLPVLRMPYSLPNESQFEYAARGGRVGTSYPWGGPYIRNSKGCLLANFKPGRGNYTDDGGAYTVNVRSYYPNDFGLYNMSGNVAEWTSTSYYENAATFVHDLNPTYNYEAKPGEQEVSKRKVVRGGSWKDIGYFLQNSSKSFEYQDSAKSYVGFRCISPTPDQNFHASGNF